MDGLENKDFLLEDINNADVMEYLGITKQNQQELQKQRAAQLLYLLWKSQIKESETKAEKLSQSEDILDTKETVARHRSGSSMNEICSELSSCFGFCVILMTMITITVFVILMLEVNAQLHPKKVPIQQNNITFFDYLLTDTFLVADDLILSEKGIVLDTPNGGVHFGGDSLIIYPNGTMFSRDAYIKELSMKMMKIKGSTIMANSPINDRIIIDLDTIEVKKGFVSMSLNCSGFVVENKKLFNSKGKELTWPGSDDSRFSDLDTDGTNRFFSLAENRQQKRAAMIKRVDKKKSFSKCHSNLSTNFNYFTCLAETKKYSTHNIDTFNTTGSINSNSILNKVLIGKCIDSKCEKVIKKSIKVNYAIDKFLIFNDSKVAILHQNVLTVLNQNGKIVGSQIDHVDEIRVVNNDCLYFSKDFILFQWKEENSPIQITRDVKNFIAERYNNKLYVFSDCITPKNDGEVKMYCNKKVKKFVVSKSNDIFAYESESGYLLHCKEKTNDNNIKQPANELMCNKLVKLNSSDISLGDPNPGSLTIISRDEESRKLIYTWIILKKQKGSLQMKKLLSVPSNRTASEIVVAKIKRKYPRIFTLAEDGFVLVTNCLTSKCAPAFVN